MTSDVRPAAPDVFDQIAAGMPDEELRECLARALREKRDEHDKYMRLLIGQTRHDERVWSAARRSAIFDAGTVFELAGRQRLDAVTHSASALAHRAQNLGERPKKQTLADLVTNAERLTWELKISRELAETAAMTAIRDRDGEIDRLRTFVKEFGKALHAGLGADGPSSCECAGCRLIIDMDLTPMFGPRREGV
jgi:hypothetical protein